MLKAARESIRGVGGLLRWWRRHRGLSQMALALQAGVSPKHLSFVETGRSNASRDVLLRLASVLEMPLRDRNDLLESAGFSRMYGQADLPRWLDRASGTWPQSREDGDSVRRALHFMLRQQEPYSAVVIDRAWNVLQANRPHEMLLDVLLGERVLAPETRGNLIRIVFDPAGLRPAIVNWNHVARTLLDRLRRELVAFADDRIDALLEEALSYPDVPDHWSEPDPVTGPKAVLPIHLRGADVELRLFNVIATLGTPRDVNLEEIRIELFFPADDETDRTIRAAMESVGRETSDQGGAEGRLSER